MCQIGEAGNTSHLRSGQHNCSTCLRDNTVGKLELESDKVAAWFRICVHNCVTVTVALRAGTLISELPAMNVVPRRISALNDIESDRQATHRSRDRNG